MNDLQERVRGQVVALEAITSELPQLDLEPVHHWAPGVYVRELFIPEGTVLTGQIHRKALMNVLVSGSVRVNTNEGMETLVAPHIFTHEAGAKRAFYAITDAIWLNIHPTEETDLDAIEKEFIAPDFESLEELECLG